MWLAYVFHHDSRWGQGGVDDLLGVYSTREEAWEAAGLNAPGGGVYTSQILEIVEKEGNKVIYSEEYDVNGDSREPFAKFCGAHLSLDGGREWKNVPGPYAVGERFKIPQK